MEQRTPSLSAAASARLSEDPTLLPGPHELGYELTDAIEAARANLLAAQRLDGHFCGELEGDTILESEYALLLYFMEQFDDGRAQKLAAQLRARQQASGGWSIYPGGPPEVSASVKAYFVLKLIGDDPSSPHMLRAKRVIARFGGLEAVNTYTKLLLALFGQYDWSQCPAVPPEMVLLPRWAYFNLNAMSSWSRTIFVPLSVLWATRPRCEVPDGANLRELAPSATLRLETAPHKAPHVLGELRDRLWARFFHGVDALLKRMEDAGVTPLRERALKAAERWIRERLVESDGLGAIFPAMLMASLALRARGYALEHPLVQGQLAALRALELDRGERMQVQPCLSPVWDTAQAASALLAAGLKEDDPRVIHSASWLLGREARRRGDWHSRQTRRFSGAPSGWYFEYANEFYPDCDDTAEVIAVLHQVKPRDPLLGAQLNRASMRGLRWLLAMQNADGGFGAFDRGCDRDALTFVPFADHNAMLDPSWEDVTGRVLESLAVLGFRCGTPCVDRAVAFLREKQEEDGTWYGRWGCNYLYGTWLALRGLACVGEDMAQPRYQRAAAWIREHQNEDGGFGESPRSYDDPEFKGRGPSTAAQTSWALIALMSCGDLDSSAVQRAVAYLLRTQCSDGGWKDEAWTGTGFPRVFYLRYDLYDDYFPALALGLYQRALSGTSTLP